MIADVGLVPQKLALVTGYPQHHPLHSVVELLTMLRDSRQQNGSQHHSQGVMTLASIGLEGLPDLPQPVMQLCPYL